MRKTGLAIAAFEDGRGLQTKECGQPLETGKDKEMDCPLEPREGTQPTDTLIAVQCSSMLPESDF